MVKVKSRFEISDRQYYYTAGYYTTNKWVNDDTIVVARSKHPLISIISGEKTELVRINLATGEKSVICDDVRGFETFVVYGSEVYYSDVKNIKVADVFTGESRVLFAGGQYTEDESAYFTMPEVTHDGRYLSTFIHYDDKPTKFFVVDTTTGEGKMLFEKAFAKPFDLANHGMICPVDPDLMFFAHEGKTQYVSNRLWIYDAKKGEMYNLAKQYLDKDGNLGDCFGHEMWSPDGKGVYFVKYPCSPVPPRGICYVDLQTRTSEVIYSSYPYWHVGVSENNKYLLADTQANNVDSMVVVIDREDGSESVVDEVKIKDHPCHPHPQMSPDNKKVIYTAYNDEGRVSIKGVVLE